VIYCDIMEYPPKWDIFPMEDFITAVPRAAGKLAAELLVQARPNGRLLDHFRLALGGNSIVDVNFQLASIWQIPAATTLSLRYQVWPKDIELRRNMVTSAWTDISAMVAARDAVVISHGLNDSEEPMAPEQVADLLQQANIGGAIRYAIVIGEDQRLWLQLQGLPAPAATLQSRPALRG
jgi:hypothetical protein